MTKQTNDVLANKIDNLEKRVSGMDIKVDKIAENNRIEHGSLFKSITRLTTTINIATRVLVGFIAMASTLLVIYINVVAIGD